MQKLSRYVYTISNLYPVLKNTDSINNNGLGRSMVSRQLTMCYYKVTVAKFMVTMKTIKCNNDSFPKQQYFPTLI